MNKKKYENLTADDVWAMMAETDRRMQETDKHLKDMSVKVEKLLAESAARAEAAAERAKVADEKFEKLCGKVGGIDENIGHHAEQFFQESLLETKMFGGQKYDRMLKNLKCGNGRISEMEFDIVLVNGKSVAVIEVKNRIHPKFVKELAGDRLTKFRELFPEYQKHKVYLGIAGFSFSDAVRQEARKLGIGIIKQVGKSIEIEDKKLKAY